MNVGIIGLGYWGNIILKNLENIGYKDIILCESDFQKVDDYKSYKSTSDFSNVDCDYVFITTPTSTHYEMCKYFLDKGINVFCEKPLVTSSSQVETLYDIAFKKNAILFTDWIFTFNSHIDVMKKDYTSGKLGKIRSIFMNRLNLGPERYDVSARWDLAAHDVSIIQYLFSETPIKIRWTDYKRNKNSTQQDSSLGLIEFNDFSASINVSWHYRKKVRECVFEFEKYFVVWDDYKRVLEYEDSSNMSYPIYSGNLSYPCNEYSSPLINSINTFFSFTKEDMKMQRKLTSETTKILES